jgi:hypothetical protein
MNAEALNGCRINVLLLNALLVRTVLADPLTRPKCDPRRTFIDAAPRDAGSMVFARYRVTLQCDGNHPRP